MQAPNGDSYERNEGDKVENDRHDLRMKQPVETIQTAVNGVEKEDQIPKLGPASPITKIRVFGESVQYRLTKPDLDCLLPPISHYQHLLDVGPIKH